MISNPIYYFRDFKNDINSESNNFYIQKTKKIFNAFIPFVSLYQPVARPLTISLSLLRAASQIPSIFTSAYNQNYKKSANCFFNALLASVAVSAAIFNNVKAMTVSSFHDSAISVKKLFLSVKNKELNKIYKRSLNMLNNSLYLGLLVFGNIELVVVSLACQILLESYKSYKKYRKGDYLECITHFAMGIIRAYQLKPQAKLAYWKWTYNPVCTGEIKQAKNGFVYLDIDDEFIYQLTKLYKENNMDLPPYFNKNGTGAHITIFKSQEVKDNNLKITDVGKKVKFNISYFDTVKPHGWSGVSKVSFIGVNAPELESLRQKYNLSAKVNIDHDFHITTGTKYNT